MTPEQYLLEVFPEQMKAMFAAHNDDLRAHPTHFKLITKTARRLHHLIWLFSGVALGLSIERLPELVKIFL